MRRLSQLTILITLCVILFTSCNGGSNADSNQGSAKLAFAATNPFNIVVLDDLDPGYRSAPLIVDTTEIDTSRGMILLGDNDVINGNITRNSTNSGFILSNNATEQYNISFSTNIDTLTLANMELYYALPALMDGDTVRVMVPRRYILPASSNGGNNGGNNNGGNNGGN